MTEKRSSCVDLIMRAANCYRFWSMCNVFNQPWFFLGLMIPSDMTHRLSLCVCIRVYICVWCPVMQTGEVKRSHLATTDIFCRADNSKLAMLMLAAMATDKQSLLEFRRANTQSYLYYAWCNKTAKLIASRLCLPSVTVTATFKMKTSGLAIQSTRED